MTLCNLELFSVRGPGRVSLGERHPRWRGCWCRSRTHARWSNTQNERRRWCASRTCGSSPRSNETWTVTITKWMLFTWHTKPSIACRLELVLLRRHVQCQVQLCSKSTVTCPLISRSFLLRFLDVSSQCRFPQFFHEMFSLSYTCTR